MKSLSLIIIITFFSAAVFAQAGELDSSFGTYGKVIIHNGPHWIGPESIAIQPDGKIVTAGVSFNGANNDFGLLRFKSNGALDSSFGIDGKVITAIGVLDEAYAVAIQPDGKIIAAGQSSPGFAVARYNTDGALDATFGNNGIVTTGGIGSGGGIAFSVAIQPNSKIVAAGVANNGFNVDFALVRYNTNGALDSSFGTNGKVTTDFGLSDDWAFAVTVQPDGKIIEAGYSSNLMMYQTYFSLIRYNTDGTLDSTFGTYGKVLTTIGSSDDEEAYSVAIQSDGKIVEAGYCWNGTTIDFGLVRYTTEGVPDSSFGINGKVITAIGSGDDRASSVAIQLDDKIVASGYSISNTLDADFALVRYNKDGTLDNSFGSGGKVTSDFDSSQDWGTHMTIQPDGKIVMAGSSLAALDTFSASIALARYLSGLNVGILNFSSCPSSPLIYPNPIHQTETLEFTLTKNESLTIALYDVNGKLVRNFISNEQRTAGAHKEILSIGELTSGNYFLTLSNGSEKMTVKMMKQ
ncbi:MAG TPA: T9SS type A sorting domain-containing protein [Chitinophagales bacterium]|nr:T9SS type A sorting domain-containing protein [Chitinophagales bacterium]